MQGLEPPGGACDPAAQRAAVKLDAMAGEDLRLPVQRQVPCKFCGHNMGHQRRADHATRHHPGRCRSLNDALLAVPAGILRTDRADDTRPRGHDIQRFADILADAHPQGATAGIACVFGFDDDLDAGQMPRQCPHVACRRARRGGAGLARPAPLASSGASSFAAAGTSARSPRPRAVCVGSSVASFSDLAPKIMIRSRVA